MLHFNRHGHRVLALVSRKSAPYARLGADLSAFSQIGGATGSIGDPSGRSTERNALASDVLERNVAAITSQVERFFERGRAYKGSLGDSSGELQVVNNRDWYQGVGVLDFLRDVGKYARVNTMMARDR